MDRDEHEELNDELLAKEIEGALGVDPSPAFLPRLRARVADERVHWSRRWLSPWHWAGAAAVTAAVALIAVWSLRDPVPVPREARISTPAVEPARTAPDEAPSPADPPAPEERSVARTARSTRRQVDVARQDVVVSRDEVVALRRLVGAIAARQVRAVDIPALGAESDLLPAIEEIVLEPITLSPIDAVLE